MIVHLQRVADVLDHFGVGLTPGLADESVRDAADAQALRRPPPAPTSR